MSFDPNKITFFAKTDARGQHVPFGIKAIDRTKHMYIIGKTGMGKSTLLENMAAQDIRSGEGLAFIDPHGATAETLLEYIPEERKDDVLYFAPFDMEYPVSFNVMEDVGPDKRHLVVSGLMSVFEKIWVDAWSARMAYILQNTLMALLEYPDSTLLGVNRMLSDKNYRKKVVDNISDPSVKSFWIDEFAKYNERYMQEAGDAIKNKIGQFTANPLIRNIIGQPKSSFDLRKMMDERKIVIMNLSKGLVGESNANLLGSMLTTRIYLAAMSRADLMQEQLRQMPNFYFYVDEFQSFANATFADILSEARKYKLNLTIAHQYIEQMEEEVRNAVFGNVGTIVSFRVGPFDAEVLETIFMPQFKAVDLCNLGFAQIYLTLMIDGVGSQPFSAITLPPLEKPSLSCRDIVIHASRTQYARPRLEVERDILDWHERKHESEIREGAPEAQKSPNRRQGEQKKGGGDRGGNSNKSDRSSQQNGQPKQDRKGGKNEKSLEELRSVLAGLSNKEAEKEEKKDAPKSEPEQKPATEQRSKSEHRTERSQKEERKGEKPKESKEKQQKEHAKKNDERPDPKGDLKQALADVIKQSEASTSEKKEQTQKEATSTPSTPPQQAVPPEQPQRAASEAPKAASARDPFDPKALERMLKVHTNDRTPLK